MSGSPDAARGPLHPKPAGTDTNARPAVGDRVRLVIEGTVGSYIVGNTDLWLCPDDSRYGGQRFNPDWPYITSVEVLAPPEPAWWPPKLGDVVRYVNSTYLRDNEGRDWVNTNGSRISDAFLLDAHRTGPRDVALLVRDRKPVQ